MLIVFIGTVWIAGRGERRPLIAALIATTVAGILSLADFSGDATLRDGILGWALVGPVQSRPADRRHPLADLDRRARDAADLASTWRRPSWRHPAACDWPRSPSSAPLLSAAYLTYNRAVFIALYALAVIIGWRIGSAPRDRAARGRDRRRRRAGSLVPLGARPGARWRERARARASCSSPATSNGSGHGPRPGGCSSTSRSSVRATAPIASCRSSSATRPSTRRTTNGSASSPSTGSSSGFSASPSSSRRPSRLARAPGWLGAGLFGSFLSLVHRGDVQQRLPVQPGDDPGDGAGRDRRRLAGRAGRCA